MYVPSTRIGGGSYGTVYDCTQIDNGRLSEGYVIKRNYTDLTTDFVGNIKELDILSRVTDHPHIVEFKCIQLDLGYQELSMPKSHNKDDAIHFVLGKLPMDLAKYIHTHKYDYDNVLQIVTQLLLALEYIHSKNIMHRDLRPNNILIDPNNKCHVRVTDFGMSTYDCGEYHTPNVMVHSYKPPEVATGEYDCLADIWSLGCIVYELVKHKLLINAKTQDEWVRQLQEADLDIEDIQEPLRSIISHSITTVDQRWSATQLLDLIQDKARSAYIRKCRSVAKPTENYPMIGEINHSVLNELIGICNNYMKYPYVDTRILLLGLDIATRINVDSVSPRIFTAIILYMSYKLYITLTNIKSFSNFAGKLLNQAEMNIALEQGTSIELGIINEFDGVIYRKSFHAAYTSKGAYPTYTDVSNLCKKLLTVEEDMTANQLID